MTIEETESRRAFLADWLGEAYQIADNLFHELGMSDTDAAHNILKFLFDLTKRLSIKPEVKP